MPIKFRCPKCNQAYSISSKKAGTSLRCQKCDAKMRIPALKSSADEEAKETRTENARVSEQPEDEQADMAAAMQNLLDDDDEVGSGDAVDLSADDAPENSTAASANAVEEDDQPATVDNVETEAAKSEADAADDDLAAVLAFEQSLEDDEPAPTPQASIPDELFAGDDDEDEDEDESWGGSRAGDDEEMDLTPMVDVTFLLLVFFMITASFSIQKTLEVPPPNPDESGASQSQKIEDMEEKSVLVHIDSRNVISVDDEPLNDPTRLADIMRSKRMSEVLITAHENSTHDMLTKVIDASNEVGMQKIRVGIVKGND
tara:strand:- start:37169 stop:38113 length:945 start_codon:yes stop_codon:yes gene_type:complete